MTPYIGTRKKLWDDKRILTGYTGSPITLQSPDYPTIERGPPWRPKIKKLPRDKAAEKGTQTKDKEKQM